MPPRTMTIEESERFMAAADKLSMEIQTREQAIAFLCRVGYCDCHGNIVWPYAECGDNVREV